MREEDESTETNIMTMIMAIARTRSIAEAQKPKTLRIAKVLWTKRAITLFATYLKRCVILSRDVIKKERKCLLRQYKMHFDISCDMKLSGQY